MARAPRPRLIWTSGVLDTFEAQDRALRARSGQRVEVIGTTTTGTEVEPVVLADVRVLIDGALLTVPSYQVRSVRPEVVRRSVGADT